MRLTADVLLRTEGHLNVVSDRELSLRGCQVPAIENLAVLEDQYDCLDFTNNDIKKLDNFPLMKRVSTLLCSSNHISKVSSSLGRNLPNLQNLMLCNNRIGHLYELRALAKCAKLEHVALLDNPVCMHPHYRMYLIFYLGCLRESTGSVGTGGYTHGLRTLDFRKVTAAEREAAKALFESQVGRELLEALKEEHASGALVSRSASAAAATGSSGSSSGATAAAAAPAAQALTDEQKSLVRRALEAARTKEEVDTIELQLQTGTFPFLAHATKATKATEAASATAPVPPPPPLEPAPAAAEEAAPAGAAGGAEESETAASARARSRTSSEEAASVAPAGDEVGAVEERGRQQSSGVGQLQQCGQRCRQRQQRQQGQRLRK